MFKNIVGFSFSGLLEDTYAEANVFIWKYSNRMIFHDKVYLKPKL